MTLCHLEVDWRWESVPRKVLWLLTSFRWYVWGMYLKLLDHTRRYCCRNSSEKLQQGFIIIGMKSYLLKKQLQMQSTEISFCICSRINNQVLSNFYYLLVFSPYLNWMKQYSLSSNLSNEVILGHRRFQGKSWFK